MRFPYQRSVGQDLQALFRYERLRAGADTLGQSSIDEGSGALEVRDGAGTAVAIGDLPGGGVGIGIRWQGNLTDLAAVLQDLADDIASGGGGGNNDAWDARQDRDIARARRRMSENEAGDTIRDQGIAKSGRRLDAKDIEIAELRKRIQDLERGQADQRRALAQAARDVEDAQRGLSTQRERGTKALEQGKVNAHKGDVLEVWYEEAKRERERDRAEDKGIIDTIAGWYDDLFGDDGPLQSVADTAWRNQHEVTQARDGKPSLGDRIKTVDATARGAASAASAAQSTANSAQTAAGNAQSTANAAQTAAGNAQSTANGAATAAASAQSSADQANNRITDARGSYGSLGGRLNAMDSATSNAQSTANSVQSEVQAARLGASTLSSRITTLQNGQAQLASAITTIVTAVNNLRSRVAALDGGPGGPIVIP